MGVGVCCSMLQCVRCGWVLQPVAVCCVLQCVAACCSVLQGALPMHDAAAAAKERNSVLQCVVICCIVLIHCVETLQHALLCCIVLQRCNIRKFIRVHAQFVLFSKTS